jgi:uncharacterized membrane protein YgaE (UPF0421/DUF939 family)
MEILLLILGCVLGLVLMYFVLRPKLTTVKEYDKKTEEQNNKLLEANGIL